MKLRNKKTGEIDNWCIDKDVIRTCSGNIIYNSLAELNEEWEDYHEEPKVVYWIDSQGDICVFSDTEVDDWTKEKQIGNYFETKEEAEKAVEKLKAWKRLKAKGIEFYGWRKNQTGTYDFLARWKNIPPKMHNIIDDLDLLFCTEENN